MRIECEQDRSAFEQLLCADCESLDAYDDLFDLRPADVKRADFCKIVQDKLTERRLKFGDICLLKCTANCDANSGLTIDHLIPISTNELNKRLRGMRGLRLVDGRRTKAPSQSFGSNGERNLILACRNCNNAKKHRLLSRVAFAAVVARRDSGRVISPRFDRPGDAASMFWCESIGRRT